jgi:hypothetical protein
MLQAGRSPVRQNCNRSAGNPADIQNGYGYLPSTNIGVTALLATEGCTLRMTSTNKPLFLNWMYSHVTNINITFHGVLYMRNGSARDFFICSLLLDLCRHIIFIFTCYKINLVLAKLILNAVFTFFSFLSFSMALHPFGP